MKHTKVIKELRDWGIIAIILLTLYLTGLHTDVATFAQRLILETGIMTADTDLPDDSRDVADYNLDLVSIHGEKVKLSDFKNKVIFLNVWATWCPPCIAEMPGIQSLYEKIEHQDIVFVMLSMDDTIEKPQKFIEKKGYTFPAYMPASRVPDVFRSSSIPTTYVISKAGKIVSKEVGMAKYDTKSFKKFLEKQASRD